MNDEPEIHLYEVTDENREALKRLALSMYLAEPCVYCGELFTWDDVNTMIFAPTDKLIEAGFAPATHDGRCAHERCFRAANPHWRSE